MTAPFEIYTPSGSVSTAMGSSVVTSSPSTTSSPSGSASGSGSAAGVSTTSSTAGIGEMGVASGVVLVVVNVVAVMLL